MRKDFSWGCVVNGCSKIEQTLHLASGDATYVNVQRAVKEQHAYMALVYSILEYGAIVCDSYYCGDVERLEQIQHHATRFIKGDYHSRHQGCVSIMLTD